MIKLLAAIYLVWGFNWVVMKEANLFFRRLPFPATDSLSGPWYCWRSVLVETADTAASLLAVDCHYGIFADCRQYGGHSNRHGNPRGGTRRRPQLQHARVDGLDGAFLFG